MAKIKYTKNELKRQRDGLARFRRYLPTLLLKKQQLQMELRKLENEIVVRTQDETAVRDQMDDWIELFAEPRDLEAYLSVQSLETESANVAGVPLTLLKEIHLQKRMPNLFEKMKIPSALEAIRAIRIYLGDQQTAAVGRSKIAKQKAMRIA